jgi:hypothetical protein
MIEVNELKVIELLEDEVAGIEQDVAPRMLSDTIKKHFERGTIMEVFPRVHFKTKVDARIIKRVEYRLPTPGKFIECRVD